MLSARVLVACALLACVAAAASVVAQSEAPQDLSLMEVGSASSISSSAARPLQEVAQLLVEAKQNLNRLRRSRQAVSVVHSHIHIHHRRRAPKPKGHVMAQLVAPLSQPTIHDAERFGTKHPIRPGRAYVSAEIVGEDGKPYAPRKQWKGITDNDPPQFRSPFAKFIHPPKVGSSADVVNTDPNTALTPIERKTINSLQLRLKRVLDKLGANIVWDHTNVKNRKLIAEFDALKVESRTLMEEYELRTGVKTIAWQLQDHDFRGLAEPNAKVTDIHFAESPQLAGRPLQRPGDRKGPPPPTAAQLAAAAQLANPEAAAAAAKPKPKEQRVNVSWKRGKDGQVKAKVNLRVVNSKVPSVPGPPNLHSRETVPGTKYPSGRTGSPSAAVQIDVVAPVEEELKRNKNIATWEPKELKQQQPKINL